MKENEDKQLEKLVDHIMKDVSLESPSFDFTSKVMAQALATKVNVAMVYKPLISKPIFIGILSLFILLYIYLFNNTGTPVNNSLSAIDFNSVYNFSSLFKFSKITIYITVSATLILLAQIYFLKKHFERQLEK